MKIKHYTDVVPMVYQGSQAEGVIGRVLIGRADGAENFCMRIFEIAPGGYTARHSHGWEHEVFVHGGEGAVLKNGEWAPIKTGTTVFIPPGEEHQLKCTGSGPLVFVCLVANGAPEL